MIKRWHQFNEGKVNCINSTVDFSVLTKLYAPQKVLESISNPEEQNFIVIHNCTKDIEEKCGVILEEVIDSAFTEAHGEFNTVSGDANFTTSDLIESYENSNGDCILETMVKQIIQNMDLKSVIKSSGSFGNLNSKINVGIFKEIDNEVKYIQDGDRVIMVTSERGLHIVEGDVRLVRTANMGPNDSGELFVDYGMYSFHISESLYVIKKETFEDFGGKINYNLLDAMNRVEKSSRNT